MDHDDNDDDNNNDNNNDDDDDITSSSITSFTLATESTDAIVIIEDHTGTMVTTTKKKKATTTTTTATEGKILASAAAVSTTSTTTEGKILASAAAVSKTGSETGSSRKTGTKPKKIHSRIEIFAVLDVRRVETTTETQTHQMSPQLSTEEMLIDAIQNKSCKDVIEALENGAIRDLNGYESVLKVQYDFVGNELKRIGKLAGRANATKEKNDLNAKYIVLSIYLSTINLTEKTMSLKKWYTIRIELRHIDLERTQNTIDMLGGIVAVKLRNANDNKEDLVSLLFLSVCSFMTNPVRNLSNLLNSSYFLL